MSMADIFGWIGSALIIIAFAYNNIRKRPPDMIFNGINFAGAACLAVSVWQNFNLPVFLLQVIWMIIAVYGMGSLILRRDNSVTDAGDGQNNRG
ncbi:MAG: hypothetical protein AAFX04_11170 [Pseudomonadota bacterium]